MKNIPRSPKAARPPSNSFHVIAPHFRPCSPPRKIHLSLENAREENTPATTAGRRSASSSSGTELHLVALSSPGFTQPAPRKRAARGHGKKRAAPGAKPIRRFFSLSVVANRFNRVRPPLHASPSFLPCNEPAPISSARTRRRSVKTRNKRNFIPAVPKDERENSILDRPLTLRVYIPWRHGVKLSVEQSYSTYRSL